MDDALHARLRALPGGDAVAEGLDDLERGDATVAALLVSIGAARLARAGLRVPRALDDPEKRLYAALAASDEDSAHGRYNAWIRRLVSCERALECGS